jgi:hypothetical protein
MKDGGLVAGNSFEDMPIDLPHSIVFWVRVPASADGSYPFPTANSIEDQVSFVLTTPLTTDEMSAQNLIKDVTEGSWQHTLSKAQADANAKAEQIKQIDLDTFALIRVWCSNQEEGCEEAFLSLGIEDKTNARYMDYVNQKDAIKADQADKKAALV